VIALSVVERVTHHHHFHANAQEALKHYSEHAMTFRFVSNVDSTDFAEAVFAFTFG
jgi:hypothetical protein